MNTKSVRRYLGYALSISLLFVLIAPTGTVHAAFPGTNGKIAFLTTRDGNGEIYAMNSDGTGQTNLSNNPASESDPNWSPDGTKIVFISNRDGHSQIYLMNADGSGQVNLSNNTYDDVGRPSWSPDGTRIAFMSVRDGNPEIYVMNADGSSQTRLTNNTAFDNEPVWSPDGSKIAFFSDTEIYIMNDNGSGLVNLTNNPANDAHPSWSPDGSKIAFYTIRDGNWEVYVMNADGSSQVNVSNNSSATDISPSWSPDGTKIAFYSDRDGNGEVYVMNADGTGQTSLTNDPADDSQPNWQRQPIIYNFNGFFQPVDNLPTLNMLKAGSGVPVKFSLGGNQGLDIFVSGYPKSQEIVCDSVAPVDGIEQTVTAGSSSLSYDSITNQYTYVWKTDKAWTNTCRQLVVKLNDGTYHRANFKFK